MWISRITVKTDKGAEHIYERSTTISAMWKSLYKHLNKDILTINIYMEKNS